MTSDQHGVARQECSRCTSIPGNILPWQLLVLGMDLFDAVVRYETVLWNFVERKLGEQDAVSLAQLETLRVVRRYSGEARINEVAKDLAITVGAASKLIDRMEASKLVERRANPKDRRSALLSLTPDGERGLTHGERIAAAALKSHLDGSGIDVEVVSGALMELRQRLEATA